MGALRVAALDETGDLSAEPGSRPWAVALRLRMQTAVKDERSSAHQLQRLMELLGQHKGYRQLDGPDGEPFTAFEAFCRAPMPWGLGYELGAINAIIEERRSAQIRASEPKELLPAHRPSKETKGKNLTLTRGDDPDYLTARIARDHPEILSRMRSGEFRSVRAAALEAGIVRRRVSVFADDPDAAAVFLAKHFDPDDIRRIADLAVHLREGIG